MRLLLYYSLVAIEPDLKKKNSLKEKRLDTSQKKVLCSREAKKFAFSPQKKG